MPVPSQIPLAASVVAGIFFLLALVVYGRQLVCIRRDGGKVRTDAMALPELLMSLVFAGFFAFMTVSSILRHTHGEPPVDINAVLPNSLIFIIFTAGICGFMRYHGLRVGYVLGFDRVSPLAAFGWAFGLILAAFPLASAANTITLVVTRGNVDPQPLVDLFNTVVKKKDYVAMSKILVSAVFIQPACEEFLFRGFFYGVWKRYLGPLGAGFLACLLFAAFHASLVALAGLFVLAVCLNIAYERTGSLLVPIGMHALFNLTSLLVIYFGALPPAQP